MHGGDAQQVIGVSRSLSAIILALVVTSCESLAPEARAVKVTTEDAAVVGCRMIATVESHPPYIGPNDGVNQLRNETAAKGGNVLYLTGRGALRGKSGVAYRCETSGMK